MRLQLSATGVLALAGVAAGAFLVLRYGPKIGQAAADAAHAVNPLNHDNVFASGVNGVGGAIVTDPAGPGKNADGSWSLGGFLYDLTHTDPMADPPRNPGNTGGATGSWDPEPAPSNPWQVPGVFM